MAIRIVYCDICDCCEHQEYQDDDGDKRTWYTHIFKVPSLIATGGRFTDNQPLDDLDACSSCLREMYDVEDVILAFYPELADFLNEDSDLAATARSVELPFAELRCVVIIKQYEDYSKVPACELMPTRFEGSGLTKPRVKVATIIGRLDERVEDTCIFEVHTGYAPITEASPSLSGGRPRLHMRGTKWIDLEKYNRNKGIQSTYRYNLYDIGGLQLLCEWAHYQVRQWICQWPQDMVREKGLLDLTCI